MCICWVQYFLVYLLITPVMKQQPPRSYAQRPHSAKPGRIAPVTPSDLADFQNYSQQQPPQSRPRQHSNNLSRARAPLTNQHARIMPKNFYHDHEDLYSQVIKLKQRTNTTMDENVKLKTRIAMLEKEKAKLMKYLEMEVRGKQGSTGINRDTGEVGMRITQQHVGESVKVTAMRRRMDEAKEEIEFLKAENTQIKKSIKYTKLTEMDIEKRMILEETSRLRKIIDSYEEDKYIENEEVKQMVLLERELQKRLKEGDDLRQRNGKLEEVIEFLEQKIKEVESVHADRERKMHKDLNDCKKRLAEAVLQIQDLRKLLHSSQEAVNDAKNSNKKRFIHVQNQQQLKLTSNEDKNKKINQQIQSLRNKNIQLQKVLHQQHTEHPYPLSNQIYNPQPPPSNPARKRPHTSKTTSSKAKQHTGQSVEGVQFKKKDQFVQIQPIEYKNLKKKATPRQHHQGSSQGSKKQVNTPPPQPKHGNSSSRDVREELEVLAPERNSLQRMNKAEDIYMHVKEIETSSPQKSAGQRSMPKEEEGSPSKERLMKQSSKSKVQQRQSASKIKGQKEQSPKLKSRKQQSPKIKVQPQIKIQKMKIQDVSLPNSKQTPELEEHGSYQESFEEDENEVLAYAQNKTINDREKQTSSKRAMLRQIQAIKQLITYRLKAQRYPFQMIKTDILQSQQLSFSIDDIASIFADPPFFLNDQQLQTVLVYLFQTSTLQNGMSLSTTTFISKLRNLIDDFHILPQQQQSQIYQRITLILSSHKQYLTNELSTLASAQNLVTKQQLQKLLSTLPLTKQSIDIILSEVSLTSQDMQNLAYESIFKQFKTVEKVEKMSEVAEEDERSIDSGSLQKVKRKSQKRVKQQEEEEELEEEDYKEYGNYGDYHDQSFSMRAGINRDVVDYQVISDQDVRF